MPCVVRECTCVIPSCRIKSTAIIEQHMNQGYQIARPTYRNSHDGGLYGPRTFVEGAAIMQIVVEASDVVVRRH